mmetsp:Transcript_13796/g.31262  ORF Transcript_13796/g.31262 Transcript_13796/m.31262 type:complete len:274 (+) Transcript_13796:344-1165(+)
MASNAPRRAQAFCRCCSTTSSGGSQVCTSSCDGKRAQTVRGSTPRTRLETIISTMATSMAWRSSKSWKLKSHQLAMKTKLFHASTASRSRMLMVASPMSTQASLRLQTVKAFLRRFRSMVAASSPGNFTMSRQRGSVRKIRRMSAGIFLVYFKTSSLISSSWCLMSPSQSLSNDSILTPPNDPSAAWSTLCVCSLDRLFGFKIVKSIGVGRQNCCDGVTQSGCVLALTLTPRSIKAWQALAFPAKAAKCSGEKPHTPPLDSSSQISSSSRSAS